MTLRTRRYTNERLVVLAALSVASLICLGLELVRERRYGSLDFRFLVWNLVLAWIPLLLALVVYDRYRRRTGLLPLAPALLAWLLFLPNAPYIVTDFVHLSDGGAVPLWFDGVEISAFAWTGMLLGFVSLYLVHAVVRHRFGALAGWTGVGAVLGLVSVGVYLGRFKRWNSWDLFISPIALSSDILNMLVHPRANKTAFGFTTLCAMFFGLTYLALYALAALHRSGASGSSTNNSGASVLASRD